MVQAHKDNQALRDSRGAEARKQPNNSLDEHLQLCGRRAKAIAKAEIVRPSPRLEPLAFSGVHVISPRLLSMMSEEGVFSIVTSYLRIAGQGEKILGFRADPILLA